MPGLVNLLLMCFSNLAHAFSLGFVVLQQGMLKQCQVVFSMFFLLTVSVLHRHGQLVFLQFARSIGCYWDDRTCSLAASRGHLAVLQWARENGCPWDSFTCTFAAEGGHLAVLQWARENGANWNFTTCAFAARGKGVILSSCGSTPLRWYDVMR